MYASSSNESMWFYSGQVTMPTQTQQGLTDETEVLIYSGMSSQKEKNGIIYIQINN